MGKFVIAAYRPLPGKADELLKLTREHVPILRKEGLATSRPPYVMRAADGTIIEIFEWESADAIQRSHTNKTVQELWQRYSEVCEYEMLASLPEFQGMFASFEPVDL